jgi:hypothetical protein
LTELLPFTFITTWKPLPMSVWNGPALGLLFGVKGPRSGIGVHPGTP